MLKINTKKEKKTKEENKKKSVVPRYITFLILSIIMGGIFTALTSYAATIAASNISYSNTTSGLTATTAQAAIDEVYNKVPKYVRCDSVPNGSIIIMGLQDGIVYDGFLYWSEVKGVDYTVQTSEKQCTQVLEDYKYCSNAQEISPCPSNGTSMDSSLRSAYCGSPTTNTNSLIRFGLTGGGSVKICDYNSDWTIINLYAQKILCRKYMDRNECEEVGNGYYRIHK